MRPSSFEYEAPRTAAEAVEMLADDDSRSIVIAGGQTLVPRMIRREVEPGRLVDVNRVDQLKHVAVDAGGAARVGAIVRHAEIVRSTELRTRWPLLAAACGYVANPVVRRKGTIGGSLAWDSGRSEAVAALLAYDAEFVVRSRTGERRLAVADAVDRPDGRVGAGELIVDLILAPPGEHGWGVAEFATRRWDPALGGAVCRIGRNDQARCGDDVRVVVFGDLDRPRRLEAVEERIAEGVPASDVAAEAARDLELLVDERPLSEVRHLAAVVGDATARAVEQARASRVPADGS